MIRGFGYTPVTIAGSEPEVFQEALRKKVESPFYILRTEKGETGPNRHDAAHQIPLKNPKTDEAELGMLEEWLKSYRFKDLFNAREGFKL